MNTNTCTFKFEVPVKVESPKLEPIEVVKHLTHDMTMSGPDDCEVCVHEWPHAVLITKNTNDCGYDIFMLMNDYMIDDDGAISQGVICVGHWNDGVTGKESG